MPTEGVFSQGLYSVVLSGEAVAARLAERLVHASVEFKLVPYPDDVWRVAVKAGDAIVLDYALAAATPKTEAP